MVYFDSVQGCFFNSDEPWDLSTNYFKYLLLHQDIKCQLMICFLLYTSGLGIILLI